MKMRIARPVLALAAFTAIVVPAFAAETAVTVSSNRFSPSLVNVAPGDTVRWTNSGGLHDVTFDDQEVGEPNPSSSTMWTVSRTFPSAGTFRYYCSVHGAPNGIGMSGSVVVGDAAVAPAPVTDPTTGTAPTTVSEPPADQGIVAFSVALRIKRLGTNAKGTLFSFTGTASPASEGAKGQIQRRGKDGVFKTVSTTQLKGTELERSTYARKLRLRKSGVYRVRVPRVGEVRTGLSPNRRATVR